MPRLNVKEAVSRTIVCQGDAMTGFSASSARRFFLILPLLAGLVGLTFATKASHADMTESPNVVRKSILAGSWYPGDPAELKQTVQDYLSRVPAADISGTLTALISPHAGYPYSGPVAAYAYKLLQNRKFDTVVVIAPSHRARFSGVSVYDRGGYETPLGLVPPDSDLIAALKQADSRIRHVAGAHAQEHSLEIQLPFLQTVLKDFRLVPLVMGDQSFETCTWLAKALHHVIAGKPVLIVASSDLSHFHTYDEAEKLDQVVQDRVADFDPEGLSKRLAAGQCEACGGGPMITAMLAAKLLGADRTKVLRHANSGDVTGDKSRVVGYMAAAVWKADGKQAGQPEARVADADTGLSEADKQTLRAIARTTIEARLGKAPDAVDTSSPVLNEKRGAFVTIKRQGRLRGCIGHIMAHYPLAETIRRMAGAAAFEDPRFPPLKADELADLEIEISVLTPMRKVENTDEIQVGRDGLYMIRGRRSGLLLPQVATEYGWDRDTFLEQTCRKAGLPPDAWKDADAQIYRFSAEIF